MSLYVSEARKAVDDKLARLKLCRMESANGVGLTGGFDIETFPIELESQEPTKLDNDELSGQLNAMGLNCEYTRGEKLQGCIDNVYKQIQIGEMQSFGIYSIDDKGVAKPVANAEYSEEIWTGGSVGKNQKMLLTVINEQNFDYLVKLSKSDHPKVFPYAVAGDKTESEQNTTLEGVQALFVECAINSASTVVQGLNQATFEATFRNMLGINENDCNQHDYKTHGERIIYLVLNYDKDTKNADGVGALYVKWSVEIKNYVDKKSKNKPYTTVTISSRSVLYTDDKLLKENYDACTIK
jgi:hypothetical protein